MTKVLWSTILLTVTFFRLRKPSPRAPKVSLIQRSGFAVLPNRPQPAKQ